MIIYLDASCILRRLLGDGSSLAVWGLWLQAITSVVTRVEVYRTLARVRHEGRLTDATLAQAEAEFEALAAAIQWLPVSDELIARASGRSAAVLKALDAIHLASAQTAREDSAPDVIFATHDRQLAAAATALGFPVEGV